LIEAGVPLPLVREIVGHASVSTTLGIYGHVLRPEHREALAKVGQILLQSCYRLRRGPLCSLSERLPFSPNSYYFV
jgi:hypothetical protein